MLRDLGCPDFDVCCWRRTSEPSAVSLFVLRLTALFSRSQHTWMPLVIPGVGIAEPPIGEEARTTTVERGCRAGRRFEGYRRFVEHNRPTIRIECRYGQTSLLRAVQKSRSRALRKCLIRCG